MPLLRKILIVDDEPINRTILCKFLGSEYEVISASNGKEALDILHKEQTSVSAVLLDIVMPVMDGYSVLAELKKDDDLCSIPVIVATQNFGDTSEEKALSMGAADFVTKPYKPKIILHRLRNLINMHEATETVDLVEKDILTGLLNKEAFYLKTYEILQQNPNTDFDIIAFNVERFKLINDTYGMNEGDKLLKFIAKEILEIAEKDNILCSRTYADNFIVFTKKENNSSLNIISCIAQQISAYPLSMKVNIKFGIYEIDDRTIPITSMCDRAILAANEAKGQYGKTYIYYDDSIRKRLVLEQRITDVMNIALAENQFKVYLQPKYDLATETICGAEALVRWEHPEWGIMSPGQFIPVFERNGFITELDIYIWDKTCEIISDWIKKENKWVPVSVNVSRKDIYNENLPEILLDIIRKHGISPKHLHLEITETAYTEDSQQLIDVIAKLKKLGFIIEMDDFGSGYSSLNMISELPIDILKLDMKFIQTENSQNRTKNIMSFVIGLAKWLNLMVVAEGVETKNQVDLLKKLKCDYVQGYYFARPMKDSDFATLLFNSETDSMVIPKDKDEYINQVVVGEKTNERTMLIIDDLALNRAILSEYFKDSFTIAEASNGEVAWKYIQEHFAEIDIIMLDLFMPVMDGYGLLEKLNGCGACKCIPVIVTSQADELSEARALAMGAADFIAKPYNKEVAIQRVNKVLTKICLKMCETYHTPEITGNPPMIDTLTGLYVYKEFEKQSSDFMYANPSSSVSIIIIDIDNFRNITANIYKISKEQLICKVADKLKTYFSESDLICHLSGDGFAVFIKESLTEDELKAMLNKLCRTLSFKIDEVLISCSIGACMYPKDSSDYNTLYHNADIAMLMSKFLGKNQYQIFDNESILPSKTLVRNMDRLLDEADEAIMVCDAENYNLLYINEPGCKIANRSKKDCLGKKCHEIFWDKPTPCEQCINSSKMSEKYHNYEVNGFTTKARLSDWGGKAVRIQYIKVKA